MTLDAVKAATTTATTTYCNVLFKHLLILDWIRVFVEGCLLHLISNHFVNILTLTYLVVDSALV